MESVSTNMTSCGFVGILSALSDESLSRLNTIDQKLTLLELRADLLGEMDYSSFRIYCDTPFLFVLKSKTEGGYFTGTLEERKKLLLGAVPYCDLIALEGERDLIPEILAAIPPEKRLISWQGKVASLDKLLYRFENFAKIKARMYRLIIEVDNHAETLIPLQFLASLKRMDVVCYAAGAIGQWTQIIAPYLGSPMVFGQVLKTEKIPAGFTCEQLVKHYDFPKLHPFETIYGIVGNPVDGSKSPAMHNAAYRQLKMAAIYLPFHIVSFERFWKAVVCSNLFKELGFEWGGFTVASPFKSFVIPLSEKIDSPIIQQVAAGNVLASKNGKWIADTTDFYGLKVALAKLDISMQNLNVAIIGCGGAGSTMAAGLKINGANILLVNRSEGRVKKVGTLLNLPYVLLSDFNPVRFDLLINATPLGKNEKELPFDPGLMKPGAVVVDLTYAKNKTLLFWECYRLGLRVVSGRRVLLYQVMQQFKLLTGRDMPEHLAFEMSGVFEEERFVREASLKNKN